MSLVDYDHYAVLLTLMLVFILINRNFVLLKNSMQVSFPHSEGLVDHSMKSTVKDLKYMDLYSYCHSVYVCLRSNDALKFHLCCHI